MSEIPTPEDAVPELPAEASAAPVVVASSPEPDDLFETLFGAEAAPWPVRAARRGVRLVWPVLVLVAAALVLGGMGLGSYLQRTRGTSASSFLSQLASAAAARGASGSGAGSFSGVGGTSAAASGTVTEVTGRTLYVTTSSGSLVKVVVGHSTTVDRDAATSLAALRPGDTVVVQGTTAKSGTVTATSVAATAKGVSSTGFLP